MALRVGFNDLSISNHADELFIGGQWVRALSGNVFDVIDPTSEKLFLRFAAAGRADVELAVGAARSAFDDGPWPRMNHEERASFLRGFATGLRDRAEDLAQVWPRESGVLYAMATYAGPFMAMTFDGYADLATAFQFEQMIPPTMGGDFGLLVREPVGVVGAIVPWNASLALLTLKVAPALLAGCTVVLKLSPEAPGEGYIVAEIAEEIGLPPGVLNVVTADREESEALVRDPRVDKVAFTGSTAAGRRIASICGDRIARCTLELGGKSAAIILDDANIATVAATLAEAECNLTGQVCTSVTRIIVTRDRHDELVEGLVAAFQQVRVGDPFDESSQMGPLATRRQRERVEEYISKGVLEGATLATGGGRPSGLDRGWFVEPTVFCNVDNSSTIAQEEIFGPVLSVIAAESETHAVVLANQSIYGLNSSVFTPDVEKAVAIARQLRSGTVGHNAVRSDPGVSLGGFKQSGIGREGGRAGLEAYLESKYVILDAAPDGY
jgi:aldehyde dehydrogenase (NAD+)